MRKRIKGKISTRWAKIKQIREEIIELQKQDYLHCDKEQWYMEQEVTVGRGKTKETFLGGYVCWKECFIDEDDGTKFYIDRKQLVRKNGEWINIF